MSDASLVSYLQSELLLLSNEIKKKYPEIKEVNPEVESNRSDLKQ